MILANVLWTLRLQELVKQRVLWNIYASVFSRLSVTESVSRCRIRLVISNFGTSTGTICVLFDDSCSYDDGNTLSSSLIDNRQFETLFVDSDSWPGLRVCAAVDGRQCHATVEHVFDMVAVIPTSQIRRDLSRIQLI